MTDVTKGYMAIDQFGETLHLGFVKHPRKALIEKLGVRSAVKMYVDKKSGGSVHCGYIVRGRWYRLYEVFPWEKPA